MDLFTHWWWLFIVFLPIDLWIYDDLWWFMMIYDDLWMFYNDLPIVLICFNGNFHSKQLSNRRRYPLLGSSKGHGVSTICSLSHLWMDELLISTFFFRPPFLKNYQKTRISVVHPFKKPGFFWCPRFPYTRFFFWKLWGYPMDEAIGWSSWISGWVHSGDDSATNKERQKWGWWLPPIYD